MKWRRVQVFKAECEIYCIITLASSSCMKFWLLCFHLRIKCSPCHSFSSFAKKRERLVYRWTLYNCLKYVFFLNNGIAFVCFRDDPWALKLFVLEILETFFTIQCKCMHKVSYRQVSNQLHSFCLAGICVESLIKQCIKVLYRTKNPLRPPYWKMYHLRYKF